MDLSKLFPGASPLAVDLLSSMLQFDPRRRISVEQALAHPWLAQLHDEAAEPSAPGGWAFEGVEVEQTLLVGCWGAKGARIWLPGQAVLLPRCGMPQSTLLAVPPLASPHLYPPSLPPCFIAMLSIHRCVQV